MCLVLQSCLTLYDAMDWFVCVYAYVHTCKYTCIWYVCMHIQFSSVQSPSCVRLFATPWTAACQASLSITNSQSPPKPMSIESVMPSNHLILCRPLLLLPSIFPSIRVFSNELALRIRWPKYWSFSFNIRPSNKKFAEDAHQLLIGDPWESRTGRGGTSILKICGVKKIKSN